MKVRNLYIGSALCAAAVCSAPVNAQQTVYVDETVSETVYSCDNTNHTYSNWRNNWFIQLGAGINQPFVERGVDVRQDGVKAIDRHRMTVAYNFGFGRWMSPYLGFRLNAVGGALHWDNPTYAQPNNGWTKGKHVNVNFELMWDMFNSLGGVNANRVFSIIPFAGFGGDYMWRIHDSNGLFAAATNINGLGDKGLKDESWTLPVTAGIQFRFRLCKYVDFFAEARATFYGDNWNLCSYGDPVDANVAAIGGFNINFGGRGWKTFNECDYIGQVESLNTQVNGLRADLLAAQQALYDCESQPPCPEPIVQKECVEASVLPSIGFTINSAQIIPTEMANIAIVAKWLQENPNAELDVVGYADRDTGGISNYNLDLSKRRAEAVADAIAAYGINTHRLHVKYFGAEAQPFPDENNWNRVVILTPSK